MSLEGEPWSARAGQGAAWAEGTGPGPWQGCWVGGCRCGAGLSPSSLVAPKDYSGAALHWAGWWAWHSPSGTSALQMEGWTPGARRLEEGGAPGKEAVFPEVPLAWRLKLNSRYPVANPTPLLLSCKCVQA